MRSMICTNTLIYLVEDSMMDSRKGEICFNVLNLVAPFEKEREFSSTFKKLSIPEYKAQRPSRDSRIVDRLLRGLGEVEGIMHRNG
jgi:hypothetical protein